MTTVKKTTTDIDPIQELKNCIKHHGLYAKSLKKGLLHARDAGACVASYREWCQLSNKTNWQKEWEAERIKNPALPRVQWAGRLAALWSGWEEVEARIESGEITSVEGALTAIKPPAKKPLVGYTQPNKAVALEQPAKAPEIVSKPVKVETQPDTPTEVPEAEIEVEPIPSVKRISHYEFRNLCITHHVRVRAESLRGLLRDLGFDLEFTD